MQTFCGNAVRGRAHVEGRAWGFSLIELLVVLVILSILLGLVLPAVFSARDSARRLECSSRLHQIGLAISNYESTHARFPACWLQDDIYTPFEQKNVFSPFVRMLPELEQPALFNATNFDLYTATWLGPVANLTVLTTSISTFLCPADDDQAVEGYGRVSYRFCSGSSSDPLGRTYTELAGAFGTNIRSFGPSDVRDGLSNTMAASERLQGDWLKDVYKPRADYRFGPFLNTNMRPDEMLGFCRGLAEMNSGEHSSRGGESWVFPGFHFTQYNHCAGPNALDLSCTLNGPNMNLHSRLLVSGSFPATSNHAGGVNGLLLDGSVRFIRDGINLQVWRALSSRAGGEPIPSDL